MNKNEFVGAVAAKANISQAAAKEAVDAALQVIAEALKDNNDVALVGFGTFKAKETGKFGYRTAARMGVNPKTGEAIEISAKKTVAFKPGKNLLEDIR